MIYRRYHKFMVELKLVLTVIGSSFYKLFVLSQLTRVCVHHVRIYTYRTKFRYIRVELVYSCFIRIFELNQFFYHKSVRVRPSSTELIITCIDRTGSASARKALN
jgi:hypothetical protein